MSLTRITLVAVWWPLLVVPSSISLNLRYKLFSHFNHFRIWKSFYQPHPLLSICSFFDELRDYHSTTFFIPRGVAYKSNIKRWKTCEKFIFNINSFHYLHRWNDIIFFFDNLSLSLRWITLFLLKLNCLGSTFNILHKNIIFSKCIRGSSKKRCDWKTIYVTLNEYPRDLNFTCLFIQGAMNHFILMLDARCGIDWTGVFVSRRMWKTAKQKFHPDLLHNVLNLLFCVQTLSRPN